MKVTDFEKFVLEQVYRPYWNKLFNTDVKRLERLSKDYGLDSVLDLFVGNPEWEKLVMGRIKSLNFTFPEYIDHPLVDYIKNWTEEPVFNSEYKEVKMSEKKAVFYPEPLSYPPFIHLMVTNNLHDTLVKDLPLFQFLTGDIHKDRFLFSHQEPLPEGTQFSYLLYKPDGNYQQILINLEEENK